jgi:hypothetical protein
MTVWVMTVIVKEEYVGLTESVFRAVCINSYFDFQ